LEAAVALADREGLASLTMRKLAAELGVEAMSLYHHIANKDQMLAGMVDVIFGAIDLPSREVEWKTAMRRRAISAREVLARHSWALTLVESRRNPGPATLRHHDAMLGCLRSAGFSVAMTAHAVSLVDSYIYGFALQARNMPLGTPEEVADVSSAVLEQMPAGDYPHLVEIIEEHALKPGYNYSQEFEYGLELVLDAVEKIRATTRHGAREGCDE
jgi:AcrR family transcriptional regulator